MNNVYDNGCIVLGMVKDVKSYILVNTEEMWETEDILKELEELDNNYIVSINYDLGMGYHIDYWNIKSDLVWGNINE